MSAPSPENKPIKPQNEGPLTEMRRVLGASILTPIPRDQHQWQLAEIPENTELHRLWAWMIEKVVSIGHTDDVVGAKKNYATTKDGVELHLDHAAKDLNMDLANCYRAWRKGVSMGLWRNGRKEEGKRKLILCGRVAAPDGQSEGDDKIVCTDNFHPCLKRLPPYIREQVLKLPAATVANVAAWYARHVEVERVSLAEIVAAGRMVLSQMEDTKWREFGIEKNRQEHKRDAPAEEIQERQARLASLLPQVEQYVVTVAAKMSEPLNPDKLAALEAQVGGLAQQQPDSGTTADDSNPTAEREPGAPSRAPLSVQTKNGSVQTSELALYKENSGSVQGASDSPSLSGLATTSHYKQAGSISTSGRPSNQKPIPVSDGREAVQVHAGEARDPLQPTKEAAEKLLHAIATARQRMPRNFAGEWPNTEDRGHMTTALKMVRTVGLQELDEFLLYIEQKAHGRAMGYKLTIALLSKIAEEFRSGAADRDRERRHAAEQEEKRRALAAAAQERLRADNEAYERAEQAWERLSFAEKMERLRAAGEELKTDPYYASVYRNNEEECRRQKEIRAKRKLRAEIEKAAPRAAGGDV